MKAELSMAGKLGTLQAKVQGEIIRINSIIKINKKFNINPEREAIENEVLAEVKENLEKALRAIEEA